MLSESDRADMRQLMGEALMNSQTILKEKYSVADVIPELIAALLSLAAYVSKHNASLNRTAFKIACKLAADEQWEREKEG